MIPILVTPHQSATRHASLVRCRSTIQGFPFILLELIELLSFPSRYIRRCDATIFIVFDFHQSDRSLTDIFALHNQLHTTIRDVICLLAYHPSLSMLSGNPLDL